MIPKKIHYCWFSGNPMPLEFRKYIESWKRFCPDYEIIRWDESNYDIHKNAYMESAYREKRWGFVPDYARFDIIYREGGIYLDTDVEVIRSLDSLLKEPAFMGFENAGLINPGLGFGAEKGNPVMRELRDMYDVISFYKPNGEVNLIPSPHFTAKKLKELGIRVDGSSQQHSQITLFSKEYFAPKDYYTGQLQVTDRTYSIHHFSCTWMTREERKAEERRKDFCIRFGDFWGNRADGLSKRWIEYRDAREKTDHLTLSGIREHFIYSEKKNEQRLQKYNDIIRAVSCVRTIRTAVMLTPGIISSNLGDRYIESCCLEELKPLSIAEENLISTHVHPGEREERRLRKADVTILAGSNLLSGNMHHGQWKLAKDYRAYRKLCLMGCGWCRYEEINDFTARFYRSILNNGFLHSVRDKDTKKRLEEAGVESVLYTGCPTMWKLTEEHCEQIPCTKSNSVVTALTAYQADYDRDSEQMQLLFDHYDNVFFWPQSPEDLKYLDRILTVSEKKHIVILKRELSELEDFLKRELPDYIGNRLHAGILALNSGCRTKVIAIDNRATEIGRDTGLPVLQRADLSTKLETAIYEERKTRIELPWSDISLWKSQFEGISNGQL